MQTAAGVQTSFLLAAALYLGSFPPWGCCWGGAPMSVRVPHLAALFSSRAVSSMRPRPQPTPLGHGGDFQISQQPVLESTVAGPGNATPKMTFVPKGQPPEVSSPLHGPSVGLPWTGLEPHLGFVDSHGPHGGLTERSQTLGPTDLPSIMSGRLRAGYSCES